MTRSRALSSLPVVLLLAACGDGAETTPDQIGANPVLPEPRQEILPSMAIAEPADWNGATPTVPEGFTIARLAGDLLGPRRTLALPNGDVLVVETAGGKEPIARPKDLIAGLIKAMGKSSVPGGNRITLLRDANGDGVPDLRTVLIDHLKSPYDIVFIENALYVANTDSVVRYALTPGETKITDPGTVITELPAGEFNHHWTKAMALSADGTKLFVGIGSNSNITERGMEAERDRAMVWQVDRQSGEHRAYATGLRNPSGLAVNPATGQLWAVVNERDELGPNLVPDYMTSVQDGAFYGWPFSYWGQHIDPRVQPQNPDLVKRAVVPDYSLGSHVAPLGIAFSSGGAFGDGVFIGEHGSWNRTEFAGYKVVFIPFANGKPAGDPQDFVTGFLDGQGHTRGRPVGVAFDTTGALLIADDLSNAVWRVTRSP